MHDTHDRKHSFKFSVFFNSDKTSAVHNDIVMVT